MLLLGEQLITDEVAAVSELIKNSYDADATRVRVSLTHVNDTQNGRIEIKDNGIGMSRETLLTAWLQLATPLKARNLNEPPRRTKEKNRLVLGEKGIGRLAVHKLGTKTEIITRVQGSPTEAKMTIDWENFEDTDEFLDAIPVSWEERQPEIFTKDSTDKFESGTLIAISHLRPWTREKMEQLTQGINSIVSPLSGLKDFDVQLLIDDPDAPNIPKGDIFQILENVPYSFDADIDPRGNVAYVYKFKTLDFPQINRQIRKTKDIRDAGNFPNGRQPTCGPVRFRLYSWGLTPKERARVFGESATYETFVKPYTGVRVFRDGFRVLPYGSTDNDWLGMDRRRVARFARGVSRDLAIGIVDISAKFNPRLIDKSDREGLVDNLEFRDFQALVMDALTEFEANRFIDREKLKQLQGRARPIQKRFTKTLSDLTSLLDKQTKLQPAVRSEIMELVTESKKSFEKAIEKTEEPLLAAAAIGLTYMVPTHEARRDIQEAMKILRKVVQDLKVVAALAPIRSVLSLLRDAQDVLGGIAKLMQKGPEDVEFSLSAPIRDAISLMKYKMERSGILYETELRKTFKIFGEERQIEIALVNMIDNSIYWLSQGTRPKKQLKIVLTEYQQKPIIVVSDNGPGIEDEIEEITLPFFTRKPTGMGLGLYICDRIAKSHGGKLLLLNKDDLPGLHDGANVAISF
jgi:signal transduction histidine kinase